MGKKLEGGCFCGAVRYRLLASPMFVNCCHCTNCQNQTGSAFVINAVIETKNIEKLKGTVESVAMAEKGERPHDIYRCRKCKVAVWSDYGRRPWVRFVRVGTLDRAKQIRPNAFIFTRSKLSWVKLTKGIPAFRTFYELEKLWPKKSLKRRQLAMDQKS